MTDLEKFLTDLTNSELATFIAYRFENFLGKSREKIINEVKRRGLSYTDLKKLFEDGLQVIDNGGITCPQCGSHRFFVETDYEIRQHSYGNYEVAHDSNRCRICGFNPAKSPQKGLIRKIKQALGFYEETRLKRPEIDDRMFL